MAIFSLVLLAVAIIVAILVVVVFVVLLAGVKVAATGRRSELRAR